MRPRTIVVEADGTAANASLGGETHEIAEVPINASAATSDGYVHAVDPVDGLVLERNNLDRRVVSRGTVTLVTSLEARLHSIAALLSSGAEA